MTVATPTGAFRAWFTVVLVLLAAGIGVAASITYTTITARRICGMVVLLDDRNQALPPGDADTMRFRSELHRFRQQNGC